VRDVKYARGTYGGNANKNNQYHFQRFFHYHTPFVCFQHRPYYQKWRSPHEMQRRFHRALPVFHPTTGVKENQPFNGQGTVDFFISIQPGNIAGRNDSVLRAAQLPDSCVLTCCTSLSLAIAAGI